MDLFDENPREFNFGTCKALLHKAFLSKDQEDWLFDNLITEIDWIQEEIKFMGKIHPLPRLTSWHSISGKSYTYSGIKVSPKKYNEVISRLNKKIELLSGMEFNCVLLNYYRDGNDKVSWHADDEKSLGETVNVASLSLGETRNFQVKRADGQGEVKNILLEGGDLLIMEHPFQNEMLHQIPKTQKKINSRINLTFRLMK